MAGGDGRLHHVGVRTVRGAAQALTDEHDALLDEVPPPQRTVLVGEQDRAPVDAHPRGAARVGQQQQREQPGH